MQPQLTTETFPDLTEIEQAKGANCEHINRFGEMRRAHIELSPSDWGRVISATDARNDVFRINSPFGRLLMRGRLDNVDRTPERVRVTVASCERDVRDFKPTAPNLGVPASGSVSIYNDVVSLVVDFEDLTRDAVPTVGSLSEATGIDTEELDIPNRGGFVELEDDFFFGNENRAKVLRNAATQSNQALTYTNRVDTQNGLFVVQLGKAGRDLDESTSFSPETVTLSPSNGNVIGDPSVQRQPRRDVTHVTVLGAGQGNSQARVTVQSADFDGGRRVHEYISQKFGRREQNLEKYAKRRLAEIESSPQHVEVDLTVPIQEQFLFLGDDVSVTLPERGLDLDLRVVDIAKRYDTDGALQDVTLSNRRTARPNDPTRTTERDVRTLEVGEVSFINSNRRRTGFVQTDVGESQTLVLADYPSDIVAEQRVDLIIQGRDGGGGVFPSDIEVAVNGAQITTVAGDSDARSRSTVDLRGQLSPGENDISATPQSTGGRIQLTLTTVLRQEGQTETA